jgi:hypothetical protein
MPAAKMLRQKNAKKTDSPKTPVQQLPLYLPSSLPQHAECSMELREIEWCWRVSQANEALDGVRASL